MGKYVLLYIFPFQRDELAIKAESAESVISIRHRLSITYTAIALAVALTPLERCNWLDR